MHPFQPSCNIQRAFYSGDRIPEWENNLFLAALSGMHIVRVVIETNRVVGEERLLASEGQRFWDITQGPDGALYVNPKQLPTDSPEGTLVGGCF